MNTWFISDPHFDHGPDKVIKFCDRPFSSVEEMNNAIIANYRKVVRPGDIVWFVGDVFFGTYEQSKAIMDQLPGRKRLVQGNHDKFSQVQYLSMGFEIVVEEVVLRMFGRRVRLCHYPRQISIWQRLFLKIKEFNFKYDIKFRDRRIPMDGRWLIHGHTHSKHKSNPKLKTIHVGVDAWDFKPVKITEIESLISRGEHER